MQTSSTAFAVLVGYLHMYALERQLRVIGETKLLADVLVLVIGSKIQLVHDTSLKMRFAAQFGIL